MGSVSIDAGDERRGSEDGGNYRRTPSESMPPHQSPASSSGNEAKQLFVLL